MAKAYSIVVRGVVQGVGFRPFVYRLAHDHHLRGWVLNAEQGVEMHVEGDEQALQYFVEKIKTQPPQAATISDLHLALAPFSGFAEFSIRESTSERQPTVRISPDLPVCQQCLQELFAPQNRRHHYAYINCTNCGPRYSVIKSLPYERPNTTMAAWPLDDFCAAEYSDPANRRFHAQPVGCAGCGPHYFFQSAGGVPHRDQALAEESASESEKTHGDAAAIHKAVEFLNAGKIVAVKGLGGYHLTCDAKSAGAVSALRARKFRKEKPFAIMAKNIAVAGNLVLLTREVEALLTSVARPIVLARAKTAGTALAREPAPTAAPQLAAEVAPENDELGVMLPYTPLHALLFAAGAPDVLVMTSANRSSEPIAYEDADARQQLAGIADAFLIGERPIARRVDDSVVREGAFGPAVLRRARGYAPSAAAQFPITRPILAVGADLKNSITLVVDGQAFVSQHIGDLDHYQSFCAFAETIRDLLAMYKINPRELLVVHDAHPQSVSTIHATELAASAKVSEIFEVQHHRAHIASVLAERRAWDQRVLGVSFDGTGYGDDGTIWGGEIFLGSIREGFSRTAHLRRATLPGGDAAATHPVQAAAGFLSQLRDPPVFTAAPFFFPSRYLDAQKLVTRNVRCFATTSMGRLFDTAAALLGFTREITFEGQAAMWLERLATQSYANASGPTTTTASVTSTEVSTATHAEGTSLPGVASDAYPFPFVGDELDFRPLLEGLIRNRMHGRNKSEIARAFQRGIAQGLCHAVDSLRHAHVVDTVVLSGGVFQNELLLRDIKDLLGAKHDSANLRIWTNHIVPANDGGISLGQAALAAFAKPPRARLEETDTTWLAEVT